MEIWKSYLKRLLHYLVPPVKLSSPLREITDISHLISIWLIRMLALWVVLLCLVNTARKNNKARPEYCQMESCQVTDMMPCLFWCLTADQQNIRMETHRSPSTVEILRKCCICPAGQIRLMDNVGYLNPCPCFAALKVTNVILLQSQRSCVIFMWWPSGPQSYLWHACRGKGQYLSFSSVMVRVWQQFTFNVQLTQITAMYRYSLHFTDQSGLMPLVVVFVTRGSAVWIIEMENNH